MIDPTIVLVGPARFRAEPPFAGGLESFVATLAAALRRRGHHVVVVAGVHPGGDRDGVRVDVPHDTGEAETDGRALRDAVSDTLRTHAVSVIHNNSFSPEVLELVDAVPRFETTLHTPPIPGMVRALRNLPGARLSTPSVSNARRWSDEIGRFPDVVVNGVDRTVFRPRRRPEPYLAWVGRIVPEKGLHLALEAAALLETPLRFAGPIHDRSYFDECVVPRLGAGAAYEGHLAPRGLATLLGGAATTLVTPVWAEPFGLVVIESLACGTPVAGFANGALRPGRRGAFPSSVVVTTEDITPSGLAAAVLRTAPVRRSRCRSCTAAFDLERMVSIYEQRYRFLPGGCVASGLPSTTRAEEANAAATMPCSGVHQLPRG